MSSALLGPPLIGLFAPRPPLRYIQPTDVAPEKRKTRAITGIAEYVHLLGQDDGYVPTETHKEQQERKRRERKEAFEVKLAEALKNHNPAEDPEVRGDPYKTLFVSRLAYAVTEADLRSAFEPFGAIDRIRLVNDKEGKPRGYAFIVFDKERDMKTAYKETDGMKIKDRRICVDVERGRTVKNWKPRSLGGGLGGRHYTKPTRRIDVYPNAPGNYSRGPSSHAPNRYGGDRNGSAYRGRSDDASSRGLPRAPSTAAAPTAPNYARQGERPAAHDRYAAPDSRPRQGRSGIGFEAPVPMSRDYRDSRAGPAPASAPRYSAPHGASRPDYDRPRERSRERTGYGDPHRDRDTYHGPPASGGSLDPRAAQHAQYQPPVSSYAAAPAAPWLAASGAVAPPAPSANGYASSRDRYAEQRSSRAEYGEEGGRDAGRTRHSSSYEAKDDWDKRSRSRDVDGGDYKRRRY